MGSNFEKKKKTCRAGSSPGKFCVIRVVLGTMIDFLRQRWLDLGPLRFLEDHKRSLPGLLKLGLSCYQLSSASIIPVYDMGLNGVPTLVGSLLYFSFSNTLSSMESLCIPSVKFIDNRSLPFRLRSPNSASPYSDSSKLDEVERVQSEVCHMANRSAWFGMPT
jgi:hypothetical protein